MSFFFNKLKFTLGGKNEPVESELRTISLMEPTVSAPSINDQLPVMNAKYKWVGHQLQTEVSGNDYENAGLDKDRTFTTIYPPLPSAQYVGKPYGKQSTFISQRNPLPIAFRKGKWTYTRTDVWLECVPI